MAKQHPASLKIYFATEMWERYGFYVVQTLLAIYLTLHFQWADRQTYELVGSFTALTYLSPLMGGWIADHLLGQKRTILLGALFLFASYILLSQVTHTQQLCFALAGIAMGTGLLKPNISSLLGNEYPENAPHRENGFTIFYIGLTLGIILGTTIPSSLHQYFGWSVAYLSAAMGMLISAGIFIFGIYRYHIVDYYDSPRNIKKQGLALLIVALGWCLSIYILNDPHLADIVFISVAIAAIFYLGYCMLHESSIQARRTLVIGILCIISVMFWAFYFQMFMSLTLFILRVVQPTLLGISFPPPFYVGLQSVGMVVLGLLLARGKNHLNITSQITRTGNKFFLAMLFLSLAYVLIVGICHLQNTTLLSPLYLIPAYLVISLAELLLSPVGLSAVTVLACRKKVSTMMGIFFVSLGVGGYLSGKLAEMTAISTDKLASIDIQAHYAVAFGRLLWILSFITVISIFLNISIKHLLKKASSVSIVS